MKAAPPSRRDRLRHMLADLRMPGALEALDAILQGVDGATLTAPEAIEQLLGAQIQLRNNRRLQAAMRSSRLPAIKRLTEFDFSFQPSLRREQMDSLHELADQAVTVLLRLAPVVARQGTVHDDDSGDDRKTRPPVTRRHVGFLPRREA